MSNQYKRDLERIAKDIGVIRSEIGKEEETASKARSNAAQKRTSAQRTSLQSSKDTYLRQAITEDKKVAAAEKKIGVLQKKLSLTLAQKHSKEQSSRTAERNEEAARERTDNTKRRKEKSEQSVRDREDNKRRQVERDHAREIARLSRPTVHHVIIREPEPEKLRVLYLTASPTTPNLPGLRVDAEVNNVLKALRGAKHKDLVDFQHRPAATIEDLVNGINDLRPHVIHFSGHAQGGLLFDTADMTEPDDQLISYDAVASILRATDQPPTLVVLNACSTAEGIEKILEVSAVIIATRDSVSDASSAIFAVHFYAAIAAAQSVGDALNQARNMIELALPDEPVAIMIRANDGIDLDKMCLVKPII